MNRLLALVLVFCLTTSASAVNWLNTNANNQWEDNGNWSGGSQPTLADNAIIGLVGANGVVLSQAGEQASVVIVGGGGAAGEMDMTGGDLSAKTFIVGDGQPGQFDQSGGSIVLTEDMFIGNSSSPSGVYNMSGGSVTARKVITGASNPLTTGTINQSGGTITTVEHFMLGDNGIGNLNMTGGTIHAGLTDERALLFGLSGAQGSSTTTIGGTAQVFGNDTNIPDNARGLNTLTVEGTGKLNGGRQGGAMRIAANNNVKGNVTVQGFGEINMGADPLNGVRSPIVVGVNPSATSVNDATLLVKDNGIVRGSLLIMADANNAKGKVELQGGTIDINGGFIVGSPGKVGTTAAFEMSGGLLKATAFLVNDGGGQTATAKITGGQIQLSPSSFGVGADAATGSGLLEIDGAGTLLTGNFFRVRNNGDVIHRMGDIILQGALIITDEFAVGNGRGTYDLQMGSISMGGDQIGAMQGYINSGLLFSTNPLFKSFMLTYDTSANRTLLSVMKVPEPATLTILALAACCLLPHRRRG